MGVLHRNCLGDVLIDTIIDFKHLSTESSSKFNPHYNINKRTKKLFVEQPKTVWLSSPTSKTVVQQRYTGGFVARTRDDTIDLGVQNRGTSSHHLQRTQIGVSMETNKRQSHVIVMLNVNGSGLQKQRTTV